MTAPHPHRPLALLGGLTPAEFMKHYWQRKPLLIRQAIPGFQPNLSIADIRQLVRREEVESRLIWHDDKGWHLKRGPLQRLPSQKKANWTALAQSVDLHDDGMAELMRRFRFISDARLDDLMISIATDGGGVGPHFDSYDVFLLQAHGQRRWRISQQDDRSLIPGLPLKILRDMQVEDEFVLEPGDMLYLPPQAAHDGIAIGDCMTISIGFRVPTLATLASGILEAAADQVRANAGEPGGLYGHPALPGPSLQTLFTDAGSRATRQPARIPDALIASGLDSLRKLTFNKALASRFLGMWLTNLPDNALFDPPEDPLDASQLVAAGKLLTLDRCTRLMYRGKALFINGEVAAQPASAALRRLADDRTLSLEGGRRARLSPEDLDMLADWHAQGWLHITA